MTHAAIQKIVLLMAACVLAALAGDLLGYIRLDLIGNRINKIEKVVLIVTSRQRVADRIEKSTNSAGISYAVSCDKDLSAVSGANDLRKNANGTIQNILQSRRAVANTILACRIATSLPYAQWMKNPGRVLSASAVLQSVGVSTSDDIVIDTTRGSLWGSQTLAGYISAGVIVLLLVVGATFLRSWKQDILAAASAITSSPYYVLLPTLVSVVAAIITGFAKQRLLDIAKSATLFESLVYAPIAEEIVYRFFLFELVKRYSNNLFSGVVVSLGFAYAHHGDAGAFLGYFVFAIAQQFLYVKCRSVSLCIASHALCNLVVVLGREAL